MSSIIVTAPADTIGSVKFLASVERFMQSIHGKSPDAQMVAHLRAIHEHVLSLLGDVNDDGDDGNDEEVDDPDQLEDQSNDEDKVKRRTPAFRS
jgi:hypothetical protein